MDITSTTPSLYSKKDFPIKSRWLLKPAISGLFSAFFTLFIIFVFVFLPSQTESDKIPVGILLIISLVIYIISFFVSLFIAILRRMTFDFSLSDHFIVLHQGIISRQQRNIPYAVIQNVIVSQDIIDRVLGLTTFSVENAVQDMQAMMKNSYNYRYSNSYFNIGFVGNKVIIPGLSRDDALKLKEFILKKMKEEMIHPSVGGL